MKAKSGFGLLGFLCASCLAAAADLDFLERFALAPDRAKVLEELVPGTEDYYYFTCLYKQQQGQFDEVDVLVKNWLGRLGETDQAREIQNRQALLRYATQPEKTLEYLTSILGLAFNQQRQVPGAAPDLPTALDPALIGRETLLKRTLENPQYHSNVDGFSRRAYNWLLSVDLDATRLRALLQSVDLPDYPNLPTLIAADLRAPNSGGFGSLPVHLILTTAQLDELLHLMPELADNDAFLTAYMRRLQPGEDQINWRALPELYGPYLDRLCAFVEKLSPAHNSLRAHALYHRLAFEMSQGIYDKDKFAAYLRVPRIVAYTNETYMNKANAAGEGAALDSDFVAATGLAPVAPEEPLVRAFLQHLFETGTAYDEFKTFIREDYLKRLFAETKLLQGEGDLERWYSWLDAPTVEALKKRVDVQFAPENKRLFTPDEPVTLAVEIKNVDRLLVRVFEIDSKSYFQQFGREIDTDIELDGLVANREDVYNYTEPPLKRVRREFAFPQLTGRGIWVIEFVGNGTSSRAIIQKGRLQCIERTGAAGQMFSVFDETGARLPDANVWFAGHTYTPNEKGEIAIPFSTEPGAKPVVLMQGEFATLAQFQHETENYSLVSNFDVDTEALRAGATATVGVRALLYLNAAQMPLSFVKDPVLTIFSQTLDGITTRQEIRDFALRNDDISIQSFRVPENLAQLRFVLTCSVDRLLEATPASLTAEKTILINGINATQQTSSFFLTQSNHEYTLELRDKTGNPVPARGVQIDLKHADFVEPVTVWLKTDQNGCITLGALEDIEQLTATSANMAAQHWALRPMSYSYPAILQASTKDNLRVPYTDAIDPSKPGDVTLLEIHNGVFVSDRSDMLRLADGYIWPTGLAAGDYLLHIKPTNQRIQIRLTDGEVSPYYVASRNRILRVDQPSPLQIQSVGIEGDAVRVVVTGTNDFTRVHYVATRFLPDGSAFSMLASRSEPDPGLAPIAPSGSLYQSGRRIGDEAQYILERRFAAKFPGNMLERPSLLLNPWSLQETRASQEIVTGAGMPEVDQSKLAFQRQAQPASAPAPAEQVAPPPPPLTSSFDFLGGNTAGAYNLKPDANGVVSIPLAELHGRRYLQVVATDPLSTVAKLAALPTSDVAVQDLRLSKTLDPKNHFIEQKRIAVLNRDETLRISATGDTDVQLYESIPAVYGLMGSINADPKLAEFSFVARWPRLTDDEKRSYYGKYASHELNFFLYNKDRAFFDQVVRPFIAAKYEKTFVDEWLLGADLGKYLDAWRFDHLSLPEKVLLAQRIIEEAPRTQRFVQESLEMLPPDPARAESIFMTALYGGSLAGETGGRPISSFGMGGGGGGLQNVQVGGSIQVRDSYFSKVGKMDNFEVATPALAPAAPPPSPITDADSDHANKPAVREEIEGRSDAKKNEKEAVSEKLKSLGYTENANGRAQYLALYQAVKKSEEWVESNYYKISRAQENAQAVAVNAFWSDYTKAEPGKPFRSAHVAEACTSFTEMMFALSVLDLPFESAASTVESDGTNLVVKAAGPAIVFYKDIEAATPSTSDSPILIGQNYFRADDRYRFDGNQRFDKFVKDEFVCGVVYGCQVTVTNPTSSPREVELLHQIPQGALPVGSGRYTKSDRLALGTYATATIEFLFYFPKPGAFEHFPAHVSESGALLAFADPQKMSAVDVPTNVDTKSWLYISQQGSNDDVLAFLNTNNLYRIDLNLIAWRMQDKAFYAQVLGLLEQRHVFVPSLWSFAVHHNDAKGIGTFLRYSDDFVNRCGAYLDAPLLTIDPVARKAYEHMEYAPLVNPRNHQLNARWTITNDQFRQHYTTLLTILAHRNALDQDDLLALTYYMLLQDRVADAVHFFDQVAPDKPETRVQYDYFKAYLAFSKEDANAARAIAQQYAAYPVERWRALFAEITSEANEILHLDVAAGATRKKQDQLAAEAPRLSLEVKEGKVILHYGNLKECKVSVYPIDLEMLFTRSPFGLADSSVFAGVKPAATQTVALDPAKADIEIPIDPAYAKSHVVIKAEAAGITRSDIRYAGGLNAQLVEAYGQLAISATEGDAPLPKVYVKVFARMKKGDVLFYKDGYTDLRGRFDYAASSTLSVGEVDQYAILVLSEDHGAKVLTASPPAR